MSTIFSNRSDFGQQTAEHLRLQASKNRTQHWKRWGPYLSERAWGTVREDYSAHGTAWDYFPHDHARSRAYRWNEDGLAGISDRHQQLCFALALWNGQDPILKERLFGLTGTEGNHGEDVKEYYFYLDSTPTHAYMKYLYKYPQQAYPYEQLVTQNKHRDKYSLEYELVNTGVFDENRYFDVFVEYAKADVEDILIRVTVHNRAPEAARLELLPTLWFRNTWSWGHSQEAPAKPVLKSVGFSGQEAAASSATVLAHLPEPYGMRWLHCQSHGQNNEPNLLFTENETNMQRVFGLPNPTPYTKDSINDAVVHGLTDRLNPEQTGTKMAAHYRLDVPAGGQVSIQLRLTDNPCFLNQDPFGPDFETLFNQRIQEADAFYADVIPKNLSSDEGLVMRQALAGMLWSKQYYHYVVNDWLHGDPAQPKPPVERHNGRNKDWDHLHNADVISMPDKWEYPWYAAWDLAFHCAPLALVDVEFAKEQLILMLREWYMHPSGQLPAYEWAFGDVNPPVHAWAALQVYNIEKAQTGQGDTQFLEKIFHKLMLNFTWWVNRKDQDANNVFEGGFLGLDNISVFDRSAQLPTGGHIEQSDGTSWMAMYTLNLMGIAFELAKTNKAYEDVASKFWEHFVHISHALNHMGTDNTSLWDETDGFYYDMLHLPNGEAWPLKVRSLVGLIPLFAVEILDAESLSDLPSFKRRLEWFIDNRPDLIQFCACMRKPGVSQKRLLSLLDPTKLRRVLKIMLDESEFLSDYGIRSISKYHQAHPYQLTLAEQTYRVDYEPAESTTGLFGGNSNWRGPIWFPINYLIVQSLHKLYQYYGDDFKVECPTGSGQWMTLAEVSQELARRLSRIFLKTPEGRRPVFGGTQLFQADPHWRDYVPFHEYFHGDNGAGIGASHQTGWTGLVANLFASLLADSLGPLEAKPPVEAYQPLSAS